MNVEASSIGDVKTRHIGSFVPHASLGALGRSDERRRNRGGSERCAGYGTAMLASAAIAIGASSVCYSLGHPAREVDGVIRSWLTAQVASLPILIWLAKQMRTPLQRAAVCCWPLLKGLLLFYGPPADIALMVGDSTPLHALGQHFATYWESGGGWLLSQDAFRTFPVKYYGAPYLFGIPYLLYGAFPYVIVPWLGLFQLVAAAAGYRLMHLAQCSESTVSLFVLYCPAWLSISNALFREPAMLVGLIIFPTAVLDLWARRYAIGILEALLSLVIVLSLRQQYAIAFAAYLCLIAIVKRSRLGITLTAVVLVLLLAITINGWRSSAQSYETNIRDHFSESTVVEQTGSQSSYIEQYAHLSPYLLPVSVPLRIVAAIVSPFPWTNQQVTIVEQTGGWWVYALCHMLQAIVHLGIAYGALRVFLDHGGRSYIASTPAVIPVMYGVVLLLAGSLSWVAFNRNVIAAFVFLLPVLDVKSPRIRFKAMCQVGGMGVLLLHLAYYGLRR